MTRGTSIARCSRTCASASRAMRSAPVSSGRGTPASSHISHNHSRASCSNHPATSAGPEAAVAADFHRVSCRSNAGMFAADQAAGVRPSRGARKSPSNLRYCAESVSLLTSTPPLSMKSVPIRPIGMATMNAVKTRLLQADAPGAVEEAAAALGRGELVAFPTDTVYGLAAGHDHLRKLYVAKDRPKEKR